MWARSERERAMGCVNGSWVEGLCALSRWGHRHHRPTVDTRLEALTGRRRPDAVRTVGVLVYRGVSTAEIDRPVAVLADRLGANVSFVGVNCGPLPGVEPSRDVVADECVADAALPDWLVVPGGLGWRQVTGDAATMAWVTASALNARGVLAISTGSLILASAGLLDGLDATGHWLAFDDLERLGAHASHTRTAGNGRIVTASGALPATEVAAEFADRLTWSCPS
jgi:putative intracellular protease/amidase